MINNYERIRLSGNISEAIREKFRINPALFGKKSVEERTALLNLRNEYHLESTDGGDWVFRRMIYPLWHNIGSTKSLLAGVEVQQHKHEPEQRHKTRKSENGHQPL